MTWFECHVEILRARHASLRAVFATLQPPARERNSLDFDWRNEELDIRFEPSDAPGPAMDYLGSGTMSTERVAAVGYCDALFQGMLAAGLVCRIELYEDDQLVLEREHESFVRAQLRTRTGVTTHGRITILW